MSVCLRQLYNSVQKDDEIVLVAGERGLDHIVRWIHMVEGIDISSFLEGGEVVFTTGIALGNAQDLLSLVEYNQKRKTAGMVINVGPYIKEIPPEVIDFANEHDFPIFRVPWRVHMAYIMREFARQITLDDMKDMELENAFSNALFQSENTKLYLPVFQKLGYKRDWLYCVAVIDFFDVHGARIDYETFEKYLRYAKEKLNSRENRCIVYENEGTLIAVFVNQCEEQVKEQLESYLVDVRRYFDRDACAYVGIGRNVENVQEIAGSYDTADRVRRLQYRRHRGNEVRLCRDLGVYKLLVSLGTDELGEFYEETLGNLERLDKINVTGYISFLKLFYECDCSVHANAERLHLQRNSVT